MKKVLLLLSIASGTADMAAAQRMLQFAKKVPCFGLWTTYLSYNQYNKFKKNYALYTPNDLKSLDHEDGKEEAQKLSADKNFSENNSFIFFPSKSTQSNGYYLGRINNPDTNQLQHIIILEKDLLTDLTSNQPSKETLFYLGHEKAHAKLGHRTTTLKDYTYIATIIAPQIIAATWYLSRTKLAIIPSFALTLTTSLFAIFLPTIAQHQKEYAADWHASNDPETIKAAISMMNEWEEYQKEHWLPPLNLGFIEFYQEDQNHPTPKNRIKKLEKKLTKLEAEQQNKLAKEKNK